MRIALATSSALADLYPGDRPLLAAFRRLGAEGVPWVWTEELPADVDAVVVRTVWDYWHHKVRFKAWLRQLAEASIPVINPVATMQWNLDKRYLLELESTGAHLPATRCLEGGDSVADAMAELGVEKAVVKPAVSAGGEDTFTVDLAGAEDAQARVDGLVRDGPVLIQEFCDEVRDGELSLVFFDGRYSHAVRKRARPGEFRVHVEHGGSVEDARPAPQLIAEATALVAGLAERPSYARVDGLVRKGHLLLVELELIEPELFFEARDGSSDHFAAVILGRIEDSAG